MASSFADDPGLLGALRALAALGIGGIAVRLIEMGPGEVCGVPSVSNGWKGFRPARGRGEKGSGLAVRELDEGVIVVQSCKEALAASYASQALSRSFRRRCFARAILRTCLCRSAWY
jgi:hypothetical protein